MVTFPEAKKRLYGRIFVCKQCKAKKRAPVLKVLAGKVACRKCGAKRLRTVRQK